MIISSRHRRSVFRFFQGMLIIAVLINMSMIGMFTNVQNSWATVALEGPDPEEQPGDTNSFDEAACLQDGACDGCPDIDSDSICDVLDSCIDPDGDLYGAGEECSGTDCDENDVNLNEDCSTEQPDVEDPKKIQINAFKVVCESEIYLPNWGQAGDLPSIITETSAADYVAETNAKIKRDVCWVEKDWYFQWGFGDKEGQEGVDKVGDGAHIGPADGTSSVGKCGAPYCGPNTFTGTAFNEWKTFGPTDDAGKISVTVEDTEDATDVWVREILQENYIPYTYPPDGPRANDVSAELYCQNDILNYDNYDNIKNIEADAVYNCIAFNAPKRVKINAHKVVCESEIYLPNWGQVELIPGEPSRIQFDTAENYVANINELNNREVCWLEKDWEFQWGYNHTGEGEGNGDGVHKLPGNHVGEADGTDTTGQCYKQYCGPNTNTGTEHKDWKTIEGMTNENGVISLVVEESALVNETGIWLREILKDGYIPYTYPPDGPRENEISAEFYCEDDVVNYDNYDLIKNPVASGVYNCIAFNAPKRIKINAHKVVCENETYLPNWGQVELIPGEPSRIQFDTAENYVENINELNDRKVCWLEKDWEFQWGYNHTGEGEGNGDGVHKLPGDHVGPADGTDTTGQCYQQYCGPNTFTGTEHKDWKTIEGMSNNNGVVSLVLEENELLGETGIWLREILKRDYIPYTYPPDGPRSNEVSAEFYCEDDIVNYDNYDLIKNPVSSGVYNCIAFNAPKKCENTVEGYKTNYFSEEGLKDWTIYLYDLKGVLLKTTKTDKNGYYSFSDVCDGKYVIKEADESGWAQALPIDNTGKDYYTISLPETETALTENIYRSESIPEPTHYNFANKPMLCGHKYDAGNKNVGLADWSITISESVDSCTEVGCTNAVEVLGTATTDDDGLYCYELDHTGTYVVTEVQQEGWLVQGSDSYIEEFDGTEPLMIDFYNYQERSITRTSSGGTTPLDLSNEAITCVDGDSVEITWNTNKKTNQKVVFGLVSKPGGSAIDNFGYPNSTLASEDKTTKHSVIIDGIGLDTYYFSPVSDGVKGKELSLDMKTCQPDKELKNKEPDDFDSSTDDNVLVLGEIGEAQLEISKESSTDFANPGDEIEFTVTIKNIGNLTAYKVVLKDILPKELSFVEFTGQENTWELGDLVPLESKTIKVKTRVSDAAKEGKYVNTAIVTTDADTKGVQATDEFNVTLVSVLAETGFSIQEMMLLLSISFFLFFSAALLKRKLT